ncbi:MAG: glycosyltransferase family 2 protein [Nanobdellota archaeon]
MKPLVSVIIPTFNEEKFIEGLLKNLLNQDIKEEFEILVVDGNSEDKTKTIVSNYMKKHNKIKLLDNPKRKTPYALNIGLEKSMGDYFMILGAHSKVPKDFLRNNYETLIKQPEDVVGVGGRLNDNLTNANKFTKSVSFVTSTIAGGGTSSFRYSNKKQFTQTVVFGLYKKYIIKEIGKFNPDFTIGQDGEFNLRIISSGKKLLFDPKIKSTYYPRSSPKSFLKQMYNYGVARMKMIQKHGIKKKIHLIPLLFIIYVILLPLLLLIDMLMIIPLALYFILILFFSLKKISLFFINIFVFLEIYIMFGLGMLIQLILKNKNNYR